MLRVWCSGFGSGFRGRGLGVGQCWVCRVTLGFRGVELYDSGFLDTFRLLDAGSIRTAIKI